MCETNDRLSAGAWWVKNNVSNKKPFSLVFQPDLLTGDKNGTQAFAIKRQAWQKIQISNAKA